MQKGSVAVIAHNSGKEVEACLQALRDHPGWEVLLVDNASQDDTVQRASRFSQVRIVSNSENRGFAGAVNQAVGIATGNIIVVLNPDAVAGEAALDFLVQTLRQTGAGAAGGLLLDRAGQVQRGFVVRRFPGLGSMLAEIFLLNRLWPDNPCNRAYRCLDLDYTRAQPVDQSAGAALAFTRAAWEAVAGFDEGFYPVWFEDVDFCRRLRGQGYKMMFCPQAVFRHSGGHSVSQLPFRERQIYWYGNLLRYFRKHHAGWRVGLLRLGIACGMLLRSLISLFAGNGESDRWTVIRAYLQIAWRYGLRHDSAAERRLAVVAASTRVPS